MVVVGGEVVVVVVVVVVVAVVVVVVVAVVVVVVVVVRSAKPLEHLYLEPLPHPRDKNCSPVVVFLNPPPQKMLCLYPP